jgi:site-specific DNA-methyltransferase (adenine-specific)
MYQILSGDCLESMRQLPDNSIDAIVTDPPYGINFMGKKWDYDVPSTEIWQECLRVLKPGGHLLAFAGTRTQHRMAIRIEDAGFEIRDMIAWVYGSGFPKSMDISKAIDKAKGEDREVIGEMVGWGARSAEEGKVAYGDFAGKWQLTKPASDEAKHWEGWGTALKPALEPITMARKPFKGTTVNNVLTYGVGGINIDACRVPAEPMRVVPPNATGGRSGGMMGTPIPHKGSIPHDDGRFPANLIHDGSQQVLDLFPDSGPSKSGGITYQKDSQHFTGKKPHARTGHDDNGGSTARYFYCAKTAVSDRDDGCENLELRNHMRVNAPRANEDEKHSTLHQNNHPTVKPTELMRYLCRLVTPIGGTILDPFMGSGSTGRGAILEGFQFIGCELSDEYVLIADARIKAAVAKYSKGE